MIIGTAGHIDHGKTSLVKALTGIDTDRLKEEKRRGITLELGFAHLELDDGSVAGVVDVPGHERFVKAMVAGAGGVDLAILVIAADEGGFSRGGQADRVLFQDRRGPQGAEERAFIAGQGPSSALLRRTSFFAGGSRLHDERIRNDRYRNAACRSGEAGGIRFAVTRFEWALPGPRAAGPWLSRR